MDEPSLSSARFAEETDSKAATIGIDGAMIKNE